MPDKRSIKRVAGSLPVLVCIPLTLFFPHIFGSRGYFLAAFVFCMCALVSVIASFENSRPDALKLSLIAVMCALSVAGRMVFAAIPFVKPVAAFVVMSGAMLGPQRGFLTGAVSMLISNFMFGQGPWTVWQMLALGILGFVSGLIFYKKYKLQKPIIMAFYSFAAYVTVCGPILDLSGFFAYTMPGKVSFAATLAAGLPVNLVAGISSAVFIVALAKPVMAKLDRVIIKYGL